MKITFLVLILAATSLFAHADQPHVGRGAAAKYFQQRDPADDKGTGGYSAGSRNDHYLAVQVGRLMSATAYEWGPGGKKDDIGRNNLSITYRLQEWANTMDFGIRVDFQEYDVAGERPLKMSLLPFLMFPDAASRFPLYFGAAVGPGVFFKQLSDESSLSLDYQVIIGARFFDIFENTGLLVETGLKNHLFLLSSGQMNSTYLTMGAVFTF